MCSPCVLLTSLVLFSLPEEEAARRRLVEIRQKQISFFSKKKNAVILIEKVLLNLIMHLALGQTAIFS